MKRLEGKVIIVTGASSGIGRAIAIRCGSEGAKVVCSDINKSAKSNGFEKDINIDTDDVIRNNGGEAIFVISDVSKAKSVEALVDAAVAKYGRLDAIFNNAGIFAGLGDITEKEDDSVDVTMNVNFKGVWYGCKYAIKQFLKQGTGGKIVNTCSISGIRAVGRSPEYCSSKGAVAQLTKSLALDFGPKGINVNAICPGSIMTSAARDVPQSVLDSIATRIPLGRHGTPELIAGPAVFLATDDADYMTGQLISIDGGTTIVG